MGNTMLDDIEDLAKQQELQAAEYRGAQKLASVYVVEHGKNAERHEQRAKELRELLATLRA